MHSETVDDGVSVARASSRGAESHDGNVVQNLSGSGDREFARNAASSAEHSEGNYATRLPSAEALALTHASLDKLIASARWWVSR